MKVARPLVPNATSAAANAGEREETSGGCHPQGHRAGPAAKDAALSTRRLVISIVQPGQDDGD